MASKPLRARGGPTAEQWLTSDHRQLAAVVRPPEGLGRRVRKPRRPILGWRPADAAEERAFCSAVRRQMLPDDRLREVEGDFFQRAEEAVVTAATEIKFTTSQSRMNVNKKPRGVEKNLNEQIRCSPEGSARAK